jgi:hypothetical protein
MIPLSQLEDQLEISRVDLLLAMRKLGLEPIRRGMRTFLRSDEADRLIQQLGSSGGLEPITPELLVLDQSESALVPMSTDGQWESAQRFASLKLLRERLDVLEQLVRTGIELDSRQLCEVLDLRRVPQLQRIDTGTFFDRYGLRFWRQERVGQRVGWKVTYSQSSQGHGE